MNYIEPTDADAFVDFPGKKNLCDFLPQCNCECPKCQGYGGWNLKLNAYPLHGKTNTTENRHNFSHFRASCDHCQGYGYVKPEDASHIHKWEFVKNVGNCLNEYTCKQCNQTWIVDSSD